MNKIFLIFALCLTAVFPTLAGPVAHWSFDNLDGNTVKDQAGNNDGVMLGGSAEKSLEPGLSGNAFYFDTGKHRMQIKHANAVSLKDDFTIEYIIKPYGIDGYRTIMWKGSRKVKPEAINYFVDIRAGKPELKTKDSQGNWIVFATKPLMKPNKWYHVIITYRNGKCEIFLNGKKQHVNVHESGKIANGLLTNTHDVIIGEGATPRSSSFFFCGLIDDIKIWKGRVVNIDDSYPARWQKLLDDYQKRMDQLKAEEKSKAENLQKKLHEQYTAFFNVNNANADAPFSAAVIPSTSRLVKEADFFKKLTPFNRKVSLAAAGNEYEGFQVIAMPNPAKAGANVEIAASDLTGPNERIAAGNITIGYIKSVTTEKPDIPVDFVGAIPDVIMNGIASAELKQADFAPFFVKIYTGSAAPGKYTGSLKLSSGSYSEKIDIELTVHNFTLPEKSSLKMAFSFFEQFYCDWYGVKEPSDEQKMEIYNFLLSYRISPNNIYTRETMYPNLKYLKLLKDRINFFTVKGWGASEPLSEAETAKRIAFYKDIFSKIKAAGLTDDMYFYSYDEVSHHLKYLPAVKQMSAIMKKEFPGLRLMQTSFPIPEIRDLFNVWSPIFSFFSSEKNLELFESLRKRGDEIWWYSADEPGHPYPNFFLDYPVFDCRIIATLSYMYGVDGVLYWCINREWRNNLKINKKWPDAEWKPYIFHIRLGTRKAKNGMGNLVYPGRNGKLLPSLRLENLRDGLEDYEYITCLKLAAEKLEKADIKDKASLLDEARKLLKVPSDVAVAVDKWSGDPRNLLEYRRRLGLIISQINDKLNN